MGATQGRTPNLKVAIVSTGRQDLGILRSTYFELRAASDFEVEMWAGGMHSTERFGRPYSGLAEAGIEDYRRLEFLAEPPNPPHDAGAALEVASDEMMESRPDAILLVGDRHETLAIATAAVLMGIPVIHLHGGEETDGALDNMFRHAITKLSHLHLVSHEDHAERVARMGEDPATVVVVGAPGLDNALREDLMSAAELELFLGIRLESPVMLVTTHPTTASPDPLLAESQAIAEAIDRIHATAVVTLPNADSGGTEIADFWEGFAARRENVTTVAQMGDRRYWSLLRQTDCVVGNSSSGIIEAPALSIPSVTVGQRQAGRLRHRGVLAAPADAEAVIEATSTALSGDHSNFLAELPKLFPVGPAAPRIVSAIREWTAPKNLTKSFHGTNDEA